MKNKMLLISELERLHLENFGLKMRIIQDQVILLRQELDGLQAGKEKIFKDFAQANQLDYTKLSIDVQTVEVKLIEENKEA